jgi:glucan-binding YG repeat protein
MKIKGKEFLSMILVYMFMLTMLPAGFIVDKVHAAETNTSNYRHYNIIDYEVFASEMYEDYGVLLAEQGYILLDSNNDNKATFRNYHENFDEFMGRKGDNLYFFSYLTDSFEVVDIKTGATIETKQVMSDDNISLNHAVVDSQGNTWYSMVDFSGDDWKSYILRIDPSGNKKTVETTSHILDIQTANNNVWFIDTIDFYNVVKVSYANDSLSVKKYKMELSAYKLKLNSKGEVFILNERGLIDQVKETETGVELVQQINTTNGQDHPIIKDFDTDSNNNIWAIVWGEDKPVNTVAKIENKELVEKYTVANTQGLSLISVVNDKKMLIYGSRLTWNISGRYYYYTLINDTGVKKGWVKGSNGKWKYYDPQTGEPKKGWLSDSGIWYYLDSNGEMKTGWSNVSGKWYFHDSKGAMKKGWLNNAGKWYLLASSGEMKTGWTKDGGKWYFLESSGAMKTGWLAQGNKWYYLASGGEMKTGWLKVGAKWYYFYSDGSMAANTTIDGCKLGTDGAWIQ